MAPMIGNVPIEQKHLFQMGKVQTFGDLDIESLVFLMMQLHHNFIVSTKRIVHLSC